MGQLANVEVEYILVICNVPDAIIAKQLAQVLIEQQLAACVSILSPCTSVYRWQGKLESSHEIPLLIKTTGAYYLRLEHCILEYHPYEVPEIVALPIVAGLCDYLTWMSQSLRTE